MKSLVLSVLAVLVLAPMAQAFDSVNNDETVQAKVIHPPINPRHPGHPGHPGYPVPPPHHPPVYPPVYPPVHPGFVIEHLGCVSANFSYYQCAFNPWGVVNVRLLQVNSPYACVFNQTFGLLNGAVWVSHGCAGIFEITRQTY